MRWSVTAVPNAISDVNPMQFLLIYQNPKDIYRM